MALTDEGRQLVAGFATERREHLLRLLDELTDEELAAFLLGARAMRRVREVALAAHAAHQATPDLATPATTREATR